MADEHDSHLVPQPARVMLVEDDPELPDVLASHLGVDNISLTWARDAAGAVAMASASACDLILLDLGLPEVDGFTLLRRLKETPATQPIPVIVLTAWNSAEDKLRGFELGAVDYVTKPFESAELRARVRAALAAKFLRDELKRTNLELEAARLAAEGAARTKADFLAQMSHEIRTPMGGVIAICGLLRETCLSPEQRGYVETIQSSGDALLNITNQILDFSKLESGKLELEQVSFPVHACVEEALDLLAAKAAEKKLELAGQIGEGVPGQFIGDVSRLRQVLVNLLSNAVKFTHAGEVTVAVRLLAPGRSGNGGDSPCWLQFSVRDTGIGIPVERLERLFKAFSQGEASTSREYGGTGLGLAISRKLVEAMGGKMWVESKVHWGSTFHFTLPLRADVPAMQPHVSAVPPLAERRLLVVDDNATIGRILATQARRWGMVSRHIRRAKEALELLQSGEKFDLALLDLQMPEGNGLTLAQEIRRLPAGAGLPLGLLVPAGGRVDEQEIARAGLACWLAKPIKTQQLQETLARLLAGEKPASASEPAVTPAPAPKLAERLPLRVLLCEDNLINQKVALRLLLQMGYRADVAQNGSEALAALDRAPYDLVIMDLQMPVMDGLEATRRIRERQQEAGRFPHYRGRIVIVAMTASAMQSDREKCIAAGMDDFLAKPVRVEDFRKLVEKWGPAILSDAQPTTLPLPPLTSMPAAAPPAPPEQEPVVDMVFPTAIRTSCGNWSRSI